MQDSVNAIEAAWIAFVNAPSLPVAERTPEAPRISFWTAFFVAPNRSVTNNHVVKRV